MATPAQIGFFGAARVTGIMQGLTDPRLLPIPLRWNTRVPDVPATDEEVSAKYVGTLLIADLIADDAKAVTYSQGRFQFQSTQVPNLKMGIAMNQAMLNSLGRIQAMGGVANDEVNFFTNRYNQNIADAKFGVELRKEVFKLGMLLDNVSYDRLGIKLTGMTYGMYSDLKVTPGTGWQSTSSTPLTDINTLRSVAQQRYGINLDRVTLTTPALRAMVATTEYQTQIKSTAFASLFGGPTPAAPLQSDQYLKRQAEIILGGTGEPVMIEVDDRRYWSQDTSGAITSNRLHPINQVLLTSSANDGNANAYDFANCTVTESVVANMLGGASVIGGSMPVGRGPIGYTTPPNAQLNPPGIVTWAVARGAPRKHMNQASAVLTVGSLTETYDTSVPAVL